MKRIFGIFCAMSLATTVFSQTLNDAIKLTNNEQFENAASVFKMLLAKEPTNGNNYFYAGENYFNWERMDSAKIFYQKGIETNANNPLNYVGIGKIKWYLNNAAEAKSSFFKAITLSQSKDATVFMKIAEAYIYADVKDVPEAIKLLNQAIKLSPNNPEVYIIMGDAYLEKADGNTAIQNYNKAADLDKKSPRALLRIGQLYSRNRNHVDALEYYKNAGKIDSTFAPAYREKAEIYLKYGQYKNAIAQFRRYLELNNNLTSRVRFVGFLVQGKQYPEAIKEGTELIKKDSSNVYLYRYLGYSYMETGDYANGFSYMNRFFLKGQNSARISPMDYEYMGKSNAKMGKDSIAISYYNKAVEMDTSKKDLLSDIALSYHKMKKYPDAISIYQKKIAIKPSSADYFGMGRSYYFNAATKSKAKDTKGALEDFSKADSCFGKVNQLTPDYAQGYSWRGKSSSYLDPKTEKGLAKPYYEQFLIKLKPEDTEKNKKDVIEAYEYLGYYYVLKKDYAAAKEQFKKIQELDPSNEKAKNFFASAEGKQ